MSEEENEIKEYRRAEIQERKGFVPWWLILVYIFLLIWGALYLISYWSGLPHGILD